MQFSNTHLFLTRFAAVITASLCALGSVSALDSVKRMDFAKDAGGLGRR